MAKKTSKRKTLNILDKNKKHSQFDNPIYLCKVFFLKSQSINKTLLYFVAKI